jgi:hypothetical protein
MKTDHLRVLERDVNKLKHLSINFQSPIVTNLLGHVVVDGLFRWLQPVSRVDELRSSPALMVDVDELRR